MKYSLALIYFSCPLVLVAFEGRTIEEKYSCIVCNDMHLESPMHNRDYAKNDGDKADIILITPEPSALELMGYIFPCLAKELSEQKLNYYLPSRKPNESSVHRNPFFRYSLTKEQLLDLAFLASITKTDVKIPLTYEDTAFFNEKIEWQEHTKRWLGWRPLALFLFFAVGGAAANFFNFINIYETNTPGFNETNNSAVIDMNTSLAVQDIFLMLGTGFFSFLGSATSLVWTGLNQDALRDMATKMHKITHQVHDDYLDLAHALIILYFYYPFLATKIAQAIDQETIVERIRNTVGDTLSADIIGAHHLLGVVDFIRSEKRLWPKSYELQIFIRSLES